MKVPPVLLRAVDNAKKSASAPSTEVSKAGIQRITSEYEVKKRSLIHLKDSTTRILAGVDPLVDKVIHKYLHEACPADKAFLEAWKRCGRNDYQRSAFPYAQPEHLKVCTPFGVACIINYLRGWEDAAEEDLLRLAAKLPLERSCPVLSNPATLEQLPQQAQRSPPRGAVKRQRRTKRKR